MTKKEIRQKAIERAKEITQRCCKPCKECEYGEYFPLKIDVSCLAVNGYEHGFTDGVEEGKRLSTGWIPVTERLPVECGKSYIVCLQNGHIDIATCMHDGRIVFICEHGIREAYDTNPIIAWMPLPEPYKKGEEV